MLVIFGRKRSTSGFQLYGHGVEDKIQVIEAMDGNVCSLSIPRTALRCLPMAG